MEELGSAAGSAQVRDVGLIGSAAPNSEVLSSQTQQLTFVSSGEY